MIQTYDKKRKRIDDCENANTRRRKLNESNTPEDEEHPKENDENTTAH